jgi:Fe-S-cluster containining protein
MEVFEQILQQAPRLGRGDCFEFGCHPGLACFNACCQDLTIELSPADAMKLRRALGVSSDEFLKDHTRTQFDSRRGLPVVYLAMRADEPHTCPFVTPSGCRVYQARPAACRLYPVGRAVLAEANGQPPEEFFFLLEEDPCQGYQQARPWTVQAWLDDQGVTETDRQDAAFWRLCQDARLRDLLASGGRLGPRQLNEYHRALYDPDRLREYLEATGETERLGLSPQRLDSIFSQDAAILEFAISWLSGRLFGQRPLTAVLELDT